MAISKRVLGLAALLMGAAALSGPAMAEEAVVGDPKKGKRVYAKCMACHILTETGAKKQGPTLYGVFGRTAGTLDGFKYSKAMAESGIVWDETTIDQYVENPRGFMPGNRMAFVGVKQAKQRAHLIAFLKENTGPAAEAAPAQ